MTDHYVLNRREHFYMYTSASLRRFHRSHSKRDRHLSSKQTVLANRPRKPADHVSLSSHIQLSNNRHSQTRKLKNVIKPRDLTEARSQSAYANLSWFSSERVTSSLAAPPPSSVSGLIRARPRPRQWEKVRKPGKTRKQLYYMAYYSFRNKRRFSVTCGQAKAKLGAVP